MLSYLKNICCSTLLLLVIVLVPCTVSAQPQYHQVDSLKAELEKNISDTQKVWLLTDISYAYYTVNIKEALHYAQEGLMLAEKMRYDKGRYQGYQSIGRCYGNMGEHADAIKNFQIALAIGEKLKDNWRIADGYHSLAITYKNVNQYDKAIECFRKAEETYRKDGVDMTSSISGNIAALYVTMSEFRKALEYGFKALKTYKGSSVSSLAHYNSNISSAYLGLKLYDSALYFANSALVYGKKIGSSYYQGVALFTIGKSYLGQYQSKNKGMPDSLSGAQELLLKAEEYANASLRMINEYGGKEEKMNALRLLKDIHLERKDYDEAIALYDQYMKVKDSIYGSKETRAISKLEAEFVVRTTTDSLNYQNELMTKELRIKKLQRNSTLILLLLGGVTTVFIIIWQRSKFRQKISLTNARKQHAEELARHQLLEMSQRVYEKSQLIEAMSAEAEKHKNEQGSVSSTVDYKLIDELQQSILLTDEQWEQFKDTFDKVHHGYLHRLKEKMQGLTPAETRFVVLSRLKLSNKEMAAMLGVSSDAIRISKHRLMKKMGIENPASLDEMVQTI